MYSLDYKLPSAHSSRIKQGVNSALKMITRFRIQLNCQKRIKAGPLEIASGGAHARIITGDTFLRRRRRWQVAKTQRVGSEADFFFYVRNKVIVD